MDTYDRVDREYKQVADPLAYQVSGDHYQKMPIQPVEFIVKNGIDFLSGNAIKYLARHRSKGQAEDIRKAIHYCEMILQLEYGEVR